MPSTSAVPSPQIAMIDRQDRQDTQDRTGSSWRFGTYSTFPDGNHLSSQLTPLFFIGVGWYTTNQHPIDYPQSIHKVSIEYPQIIQRVSTEYPQSIQRVSIIRYVPQSSQIIMGPESLRSGPSTDGPFPRRTGLSPAPWNQLIFVSEKSQENPMFHGKIYGKSHDFHWKIYGKSHIPWENLYGFRVRFSLSRQPIDQNLCQLMNVDDQFVDPNLSNISWGL